MRSPTGYAQVLDFFAAETQDKHNADNVAIPQTAPVPGQFGDYTIRRRQRCQEPTRVLPRAVVQFTELSNSPGNSSARVTSDAAGKAELKRATAGRPR